MASFTVALKSWVSGAFAPLAHASRHAAAGADPVTPAAIGAATAAQGALADSAAQKASNLSDLTSAATARTNLGATAAGSALFTAASVNAQRALLGPSYATAAAAANLASFVRRLERGTSDAGMLIVSDSTGNETTEWAYLVVQWLAARYPAYTVTVYFWDEVGETAYKAPVTVQTGSGTKTLTVWIAAKAGSVPGYFMGSRYAAAIAATSPNVVIMSHGHNTYDPTTPDYGHISIRNTYLSAVETISVTHPFAGVVLIAQNPSKVAGRETWQSVKATLIDDIAGVRGYGVIDVHQAFIDYGDWQTDLMADDSHPNAAGSALWAAVVEDALTDARKAPATQITPSPLLLTARNYLSNFDFSSWSSTDPDSWTTNASATTTKDTTYYETGAHAALVAGNATSGPAQLGQVLSAALARELRGQWVTLAVRVRKPSTNAATVRVVLRDSVGSTTQRIADVPASSVDGFVWLFVNKQIDAAATSVTVWLWSRTTGTTVPSEASFDRAYLVRGMLPFCGS